MKKFAYAALLAAPVLAGLSQAASAGRHYHNENRYGGSMVVVIETVISNVPRPGFETHVVLVPGVTVEVSHCDEYGWCHLKYPVVNAFVPKHCLRHHDNGYRRPHRRRRDDYQGY